MINKLRALNTTERGFTLIELLVVIIIIGVLAAIAIPIFVNQQKVAINAHSQESVRQLRDAIVAAQLKTNKPLMEITGAACTGCRFGTTDPLTMDKTSSAWVDYNTSLQRITDASGVDVTNLLDGYGRPLIIDENEGEGGSCNADWIGSFKDPYGGYHAYENRVRLPLVTPECSGKN